jgi:NAD(P)-dependent dehydrogenase (short-subunit alcohol dehydrogenase family)
MKLDEAVVITGGASGLGAATARLLACAGARVSIFDVNVAAGEGLAREIGGIFVKVDVTSEHELNVALDRAQHTHGVARILVNCAGIGPAAKTVSKGQPHSLELFRKVIEINLVGTFNCICNFAMRAIQTEPIGAPGKQERGVIINTASIAAFEGQMGQAAYSASKAGVVGLTLAVARDLAAHGVRCMSIAPGLFDTPLLTGLPAAALSSLEAQSLFPKRPGDPAEFADLVKSVIENSMLNGETIRLDGGVRMQPR